MRRAHPAARSAQAPRRHCALGSATHLGAFAILRPGAHGRPHRSCLSAPLEPVRARPGRARALGIDCLLACLLERDARSAGGGGRTLEAAVTQHQHVWLLARRTDCTHYPHAALRPSRRPSACAPSDTLALTREKSRHTRRRRRQRCPPTTATASHPHAAALRRPPLPPRPRRRPRPLSQPRARRRDPGRVRKRSASCD